MTSSPLDAFDDVIISIDELSKRISQTQTKSDKSNNNNSRSTKFLFPGMGVTVCRIIPFLSKETNKWMFDASWYYHKDFLPKEKIVCLRETYKEPCKICLLAYDIKKKYGFKSSRSSDYCNKYNLNSKFKHLMHVKLISDCGDKGTKENPRDEYINGEKYILYLTRGTFDGFNIQIADPELGPVYHPRQGRNMKVTVTWNAKTSARESTITFSPKVSPLIEDDLDGSETRRILESRSDLTVERQRPSKEMLEAIENRIKEVKFALNATSIPVSSPTPTDKLGTDAVGPSAIPTSIISNTPPTKSLNLSVVTKPTDQIDPSTKRPYCFQRGLFDGSNPECQMCAFEDTCKSKIS
jgi:hypothetical protein